MHLSRGSLGISSPPTADVEAQTYTEPGLCCLSVQTKSMSLVNFSLFYSAAVLCVSCVCVTEADL